MSDAFDGASPTAAPCAETPQERQERALFELQRALEEVVAAQCAVREARRTGN